MKTLLLSVLAALALAPALSAQPVSGADLDALFETEPQVEVNLRGSLLRLAAEATRADEPETAAVIDGLDQIVVRIYPLGPGDRASAIARLSGIGRQFEDQGWLTLVRVRALPGDEDADGDIWIYVRERGDQFGGLAVMASEEAENNVVFVLIDGLIDPAQIGALTRRFGDIDIDIYGDDDV